MSSHLIPQQGTDKRGRPYTRMVKPTKVVVPKSTPKPNRGNKHTNQNYANRYLGIESLESKHADSLDFHDVSTAGTIAMLNKIASDSLGRTLSRDELSSIVRENLWDESVDYDFLAVQNSDSKDFHDVAVWSINRAINEVRMLAN